MTVQKRKVDHSRRQALSDAYELKAWLDRLDIPQSSRDFESKIDRVIDYLERHDQ